MLDFKGLYERCCQPSELMTSQTTRFKLETIKDQTAWDKHHEKSAAEVAKFRQESRELKDMLVNAGWGGGAKRPSKEELQSIIKALDLGEPIPRNPRG